MRCPVGVLGLLPATADALHHMKQAPVQWAQNRNDNKPLVVTNYCPEVIYPAIATQAGTAPSVQGFKLNTGDTKDLMVSADWQGRVWGRTNCSFNAAGTGPGNVGGLDGSGRACGTGDCNGIVNCRVTGLTPVSLAEFTLATSSGQTFYDISLVDGYNLPMGIVSLFPRSGNSSLQSIPPNLTNPVCIGTAALLGKQGSMQDAALGFPLPLDQEMTRRDVASWCPWDLQLYPPDKPGDGVYPYPDDTIERPQFDPCYSACAKYNLAQYCCTGKYNSPQTCSPSIYSKDAKKVCPDAYSFAFDDQTSTFIIPSGGGFQVVFCPPGRSTTILNTLGAQLQQLGQTGHVTDEILSEVSRLSLNKQQQRPGGSAGGAIKADKTSALVPVLIAIWLAWSGLF